jgi:hypothetical protein
LGNLGQSFRVAGEAFDRLHIVAGIVPDGLLGERPVVLLLAVGHESADGCIGVGRLHPCGAIEAFDFYEFRL